MTNWYEYNEAPKQAEIPDSVRSAIQAFCALTPPQDALYKLPTVLGPTARSCLGFLQAYFFECIDIVRRGDSQIGTPITMDQATAVFFLKQTIDAINKGGPVPQPLYERLGQAQEIIRTPSIYYVLKIEALERAYDDLMEQYLAQREQDNAKIKEGNAMQVFFPHLQEDITFAATHGTGNLSRLCSEWRMGEHIAHTFPPSMMGMSPDVQRMDFQLAGIRANAKRNKAVLDGVLTITSQIGPIAAAYKEHVGINSPFDKGAGSLSNGPS